MERQRSYLRLLGKPKNKLVSLKKKTFQFVEKGGRSARESEDGRQFQRAIAEGRKDRSR